jgi:DNA-binding NtrC family response regulator
MKLACYVRSLAFDRNGHSRSQHLPRMGGIALVARIKARQPAVRVIVMTAHATSESAIEAGRGGGMTIS